MIINVNANGEILSQEFTEIVQGDNKANKIYLIAPFAKGTQVNISFECPNGFVTVPYVMAQSLELDGNLNVWERAVEDIPITQYYGFVKYQFKAMVNDITIAVGRGKFKVNEGVDWQLPPQPTETVYADILKALNKSESDIANRVLINYSSSDGIIEQIIQNDASGIKITKISNGETGIYEFKTDGLYFNDKRIMTTDEVKKEIENLLRVHNEDREAHSTIIGNITDLDGKTLREYIDERDDSTLNSAKTHTENYVGNYTYPKQEIDKKDASTLANAQNYTYSKNTIDEKIVKLGDNLSKNIEEVKQVAEGQQNALVFENDSQISSWIAGEFEREDKIKPSDLKIGQHIYNKTQEEKDYWVSLLPVTKIEDLSELQTDKIRLQSKNVEFDRAQYNYLKATNAQDAIDELTQNFNDKTNIYELGIFTLNAENWVLNNEKSIYEYIFTHEYLTSSTNQIIEFTPDVESSRQINESNIVIYNEVVTRVNGTGVVEAVISSDKAPTFNIVCSVRIKTNALILGAASKIYAEQVSLRNPIQNLNALNAQDAISEINSHLFDVAEKLNISQTNITNLQNKSDEIDANIKTLQSKDNDIDSEIKGVQNQLQSISDDKVSKSEIGANSGIAPLDAEGRVPSAYLPSYVDDVIETESFSNLPPTGEEGKIYVTKDDNKEYRWGGSEYVEISSSLALGETSSTAYAGNKGKANRDDIDKILNGNTVVPKSKSASTADHANTTTGISDEYGNIFYLWLNNENGTLNLGEKNVVSFKHILWSGAQKNTGPGNLDIDLNDSIKIGDTIRIEYEIDYNIVGINNYRCIDEFKVSKLDETSVGYQLTHTRFDKLLDAAGNYDQLLIFEVDVFTQANKLSFSKVTEFDSRNSGDWGAGISNIIVYEISKVVE